MTGTWIRSFDHGTSDRELVGGKGASLAEMTRIGVPVPPGFTITTACCRAYLATGAVPETLWDELAAALRTVERETNRGFADPHNPLLLSVRSGAAISMPGMMDTVLNIGVTPETVDGLATQFGPRFARDCRRRLLQMMGRVVLGVDGALFESALADARRKAGVTRDDELSPAALDVLIATFERILGERGLAVPDDPIEQLKLAVIAVFDSWNTERAREYRRLNAISDDLATAVTVQAMVFGNGGNDSATGVLFTRDPNSGAPRLFGEYLVNAQGEDVVAGVRTPASFDTIDTDPVLAPAGAELRRLAARLEAHFRDLQDLEFTIEHGRVWLLQARTGKRTARAAVRIATDLAREGVIDRAGAVNRIESRQIEHLLHPRIDEAATLEVLAHGLPASPGAASGIVVLDPGEARRRGEAGEPVILVREETAADDFPGMAHARGILTAHGGMTSHAAVVARGMGTPAVTGCAVLAVDEASGELRFGDTRVREGERLTIDGATGRVIRGTAPLIPPALEGEADTLLGWADEYRRLGVRANADTPADAARARQLGAEGIGLCRTEHMFFAPDRIDAMRAMILATTAEERETALIALEAMQIGDFTGIFRAMDGLPVTIRTLDPPLHEFLPRTGEEFARVARRLDRPVAEIVARAAGFREANPMLGHRGCRLGISQPEITAMQARAILRAALACAATGVDVRPEMMIPFVSDPEELRRQRAVIDAEAAVLFADAGRHLPYLVGTMIEVPRAALLADEIARHADFLSFGTNDLTQMTFGMSRDDAGRFLPAYLENGVLPADPFQTLDREGAGKLVEIGVDLARRTNPAIKIGLCGEHGGDPASIDFCHEHALTYVSCSPFRVPVARLAAAQAALRTPTMSEVDQPLPIVAPPGANAAFANYLD